MYYKAPEYLIALLQEEYDSNIIKKLCRNVILVSKLFQNLNIQKKVQSLKMILSDINLPPHSFVKLI